MCAKLAACETPHINFFSLSRELRDQIYKLSLISPSPIIVWSEELSKHPPDEAKKQRTAHSRSGSRRIVEREFTQVSLGHIAWNTLESNKAVRSEAAPILYGKNTFRFLDEHNWDPVVEWLTRIGPENCNFLEKLDIETFRPDRVWQNTNGQRIACSVTNEAIVYPCNPSLERPPETDIKAGFVDNINPRIEQMFSILGSRETNHTTKLSLFVPAEMYPGVEFAGTHIDPSGFHFTMDLPNLIQKFYEQYIEAPNCRASLEIFWKGEVFEPIYEIFEHLVEPTGWEVLTMSKVQLALQIHGMDEILPFFKYVLRRKRLMGRLLASAPLKGRFEAAVVKEVKE